MGGYGVCGPVGGRRSSGAVAERLSWAAAEWSCLLINHAVRFAAAWMRPAQPCRPRCVLRAAPQNLRCPDDVSKLFESFG